MSPVFCKEDWSTGRNKQQKMTTLEPEYNGGNQHREWTKDQQEMKKTQKYYFQEARHHELKPSPLLWCCCFVYQSGLTRIWGKGVWWELREKKIIGS